MVIKLLNYIRGFVIVSVRGFFLERFINTALKRNIYLWDIKSESEHSIHMKMSIRGFKSVRPAAYKTRSKVKILERAGLPFVLAKSKKRKAFVIGAAAALLLFLYLTSFIWSIEVVGNDKVKESEILTALSEVGFSKGSLRYGVDAGKLQNDMLLKLDKLSWIWVDIRGTKAVVEVRERVIPPEIVDKDTPSNIVAKKSGLITQVIAKAGERVIKEGDVVNEGDLLISGVLSSNQQGYKYVNSTGSIKARTWYEKSEEFPLVNTTYQKTEKKISKNTVNLFGFDVLLYWNKKIPFSYYDEEISEHQLRLGANHPLPITFYRHVYHEKQRIDTPLTKEEAISIGAKKLQKEIEDVLEKDAVIVERNVEHMDLANGNVQVTVAYTCIEEIGQRVEIGH